MDNLALARTIVSLLFWIDLSFVRLCVGMTRPRAFRRAAILISWLGNWAIYPLITIATFWAFGAQVKFAIILSILSIIMLHSIYPFIKQRFARARPCDAYADLHALLPPLDKFSFPSGHMMTLTATIVPTILVMPASVSAMIVLWGAMSWARLASGHHYPSDIVAGSAVGLAVSYPTSFLLLPLFQNIPWLAG
jgi:undecaprenyl-diphosphatase